MAKFEFSVVKIDAMVYTIVFSDFTNDIMWYDAEGNRVWQGSYNDEDDSSFPTRLRRPKVPVPIEEWEGYTRRLVAITLDAGGKPYHDVPDSEPLVMYWFRFGPGETIEVYRRGEGKPSFVWQRKAAAEESGFGGGE